MAKDLLKGKKVEDKKVSINTIKPYWRNAKKGTNIEFVKESIKKYGYTDPILVTPDMVIIAGHSRWKAMSELWHKEIEVRICHLTDREAKVFRIEHNKIAEKNEDDIDNIKLEIREIGDEIMDGLIDIEIEEVQIDVSGVDEKQLDTAQAKMDTVWDNPDGSKRKVFCPGCGEEFYVEI